MNLGSPEWIAARCTKAATDAQPQLFAIAEDAVKRHKAGGTLSPSESAKMATVLAEIQDQSFILGVQVGMKLIMELEVP